MADDDNFDIDIYGDDDQPQDAAAEPDQTAIEQVAADQPAETNGHNESNGATTEHTGLAEDAMQDGDAASGHIKDETSADQSTELPVQQGVKRKDAPDDRPLDPGATSALIISDLQWWTNDDDIRGWVVQAGSEDELRDLTFSEHKVNGKSKGQVYLEFDSPQAATAVKQRIENPPSATTNGTSAAGASKKHPVTFANGTNPFRTLPKDAPARQNTTGAGTRGTSSGFAGAGTGGGFRGRGGMGGRGGGFNNRGGAGATGFQNGGNFGAGNMGGFGGGMGGGFNNFGGRGGGMNNMGMMNNMRGGGGMNRGGRGGMGMMNGMQMMGAMPMGMQMMPGMGGMPGGFGGQGQFNPAFFQGQQGDWNPHGAKRPRPE